MIPPLVIPPLIDIRPLIEAASRSLLLALAVWIGLRMFRVRSVPAEKAAWSAVLAFAILMPLLLPLAAHVPAATVVLPSIVAQPPASSAPSASNDLNQPPGAAVAAIPTFTGLGRFPAPTVDEIDRASSAQAAPRPVSVRQPFSLFQVASFLYFSIASMLLCRLLEGIISALSSLASLRTCLSQSCSSLWRTAPAIQPLRLFARHPRLRRDPACRLRPMGRRKAAHCAGTRAIPRSLRRFLSANSRQPLLGSLLV